MTEQSQFEALAKWEGCTEIWWDAVNSNLKMLNPHKHFVIRDYNSLDTLHDCEKRLDGFGKGVNHERYEYAVNLLRLVHPEMCMSTCWLVWCAANATAAQRREALLRTLGLWKEET
ncbi:MAG TPA: hypothetical protein VF077_12950 [Nitrospiraceae bacterium]